MHASGVSFVYDQLSPARREHCQFTIVLNE